MVLETIGGEAGLLQLLGDAAGIELEKTIEDTSLAEWDRCSL